MILGFDHWVREIGEGIGFSRLFWAARLVLHTSMLEPSGDLCEPPLLEHNRALHHFRPYPLPRTPTLSSLVVPKPRTWLGFRTNEWGFVSQPLSRENHVEPHKLSLGYGGACSSQAETLFSTRSSILCSCATNHLFRYYSQRSVAFRTVPFW